MKKNWKLTETQLFLHAENQGHNPKTPRSRKKHQSIGMAFYLFIKEKGRSTINVKGWKEGN